MNHYQTPVSTAAAVAVLTVWSLLAPAAFAVPDGIDYQGYLTSSDGSAVNGDTAMVFAAYNVPIGGAPLWSVATTVAVDRGLFAVQLGTPVNPFPAGLFDGQVYVGLMIDGEELLPRRQLNSAPYAFKASDAETLDGASAAALDQSAHVADMGNPHGVTAAQTGAASAAALASLQSQLNAALATIGALEAQVSNNASGISINRSLITDNTLDIELANNAIEFVDGRLGAVESNSVLGLDGLLRLEGGDTALFTAVNVQVVNGTGSTDGAPNGRGNLLVGYDEPDVNEGSDPFTCSLGQYTSNGACAGNGGVWAQSHKSGSHNVVIGSQNNYSRFGGLVVGTENNISGDWSSVSGGRSNTASGAGASVVGGELNMARAVNTTVAGGRTNTADGTASSISGGQLGITTGQYASVTGGFANTASGPVSTVSGGRSNQATGDRSSIAGGRNNTAPGAYAAVAGGGYNVASGDTATVSGGGGNVVSEGNVASGPYASISGGVESEAIGEGSSITGGTRNSATARWATVSGGADRNATGEADWRAGSLFENF